MMEVKMDWEKDRKRAQRRFDTWRVQRNRVRWEYENWDWAHDGPQLKWVWVWEDGNRVLKGRYWVYQEYWTPERLGRRRWNHVGCGCKGCKPHKWFPRWEDRKQGKEELARWEDSY